MKTLNLSMPFAALLTVPFFALLGCGVNVELQQVSQAPHSRSELGWIATEVTADQHLEIVQAHPASQFRNLGNGFAYEYRGLSKSEILEFAPRAHIEKNHFVPNQSNKVSAPDQFTDFLSTNPEAEFAPGSCIENRILITPNVRVKNLSGESSASPAAVGDSIGISHDKKETDSGATAWTVISPDGSKISSALLGSESISFKPDMAGTYSVVLLYKKNGQCNFKRIDFFVTNNTPYTSELSQADLDSLKKLSKQSFYQLAATKADSAQVLLTNNTFKVTKVAVLDSGVNYNHPALKNRMWTNPGEIQGDKIDNDGNGLVDDFVGYDFVDNDAHPMDDLGHGSHVAGLVAGEFMGTGAENVQIMAVKIGADLGPDIGSLIAGILYAIEKEADIINLSLGYKIPSVAVEAAIREAGKAGILVVAATGNGNQFGLGTDNDQSPHYPSSFTFSHVLAVASVRIDDALTRYSNYGFETVDIATVGGFADRTVGPLGLLSSAYIPNPSGVLTHAQAGTSMATPVAAGVAALVLSVAPDLTPAEVIELLISTGRKSSNLEGRIKSGAVIDAEAAVLRGLNKSLN